MFQDIRYKKNPLSNKIRGQYFINDGAYLADILNSIVLKLEGVV